MSVACLSRINDRYYGQWLMMNHPFCDQADLLHDDAQLVPPEFVNFAVCLLHHP